MPVVHHGIPVTRVDPALLRATHVFLRVDAVRRPLVAPYEGPFPVISRSDSNKTFVILRREKPVTVTIDRLKPAVFLPEADRPSRVVPGTAPASVVPSPVVRTPGPQPRPLTTFSRRVSRPVSRYGI